MAQLIGKPLVLSIVPDLQTPVCSTQTHKFNQQADHYPDATFVTISNNTIQQQKNWCGAEGSLTCKFCPMKNCHLATTNLYLPNMGVLTRSVIIADATVNHLQKLADVTNEPNYVTALNALEELTSRVDD